MLYKYLYLKIIRYYISNINNINDVINIFCIIERIKKRNNTDDIMEIFIECFDKYPLTEIELQKISLLHQEFNNNNNINGFVITVLWLSIIISIDESLKKEKIKKYNLNQEIEIEIENDIKNELKKINVKLIFKNLKKINGYYILDYAWPEKYNKKDKFIIVVFKLDDNNKLYLIKN